MSLNPEATEAALSTLVDPELREFAEYALARYEGGDTHPLTLLSALRRYPVSIEEFIESPKFLGMKGQIYPAVMECLVELNNPEVEGLGHGYRLGAAYIEAVLTGATGTGKTTIAILTIAYQLYVLSCLRDPQRAASESRT